MGVTRCWRTHAEKAELEPYRKGYQDLVNWSLSWVCPCLVWLMQGVAVAEMPTGEVARGRSWGFQWDDGGDVNPLLASECDCFTGCDTTKEQLTKDRQRQLPPWYPRDILDPNPSDILSPTLVPKCFFVIALWETSSPLYKQLLILGIFLICAWESWSLLSQSPCEHPLLHLLYVLGGICSEAVKAKCFRVFRLARKRYPFQIHDFENDPSLERSRRWERW